MLQGELSSQDASPPEVSAKIPAALPPLTTTFSVPDEADRGQENRTPVLPLSPTSPTIPRKPVGGISDRKNSLARGGSHTILSPVSTSLSPLSNPQNNNRTPSPAFQNIINKFNSTTDEVLPISPEARSRSRSSGVSPSSRMLPQPTKKPISSRKPPFSTGPFTSAPGRRVSSNNNVKDPKSAHRFEEKQRSFSSSTPDAQQRGRRPSSKPVTASSPQLQVSSGSEERVEQVKVHVNGKTDDSNDASLEQRNQGLQGSTTLSTKLDHNLKLSCNMSASESSSPTSPISSEQLHTRRSRIPIPSSRVSSPQSSPAPRSRRGTQSSIGDSQIPVLIVKSNSIRKNNVQAAQKSTTDDKDTKNKPSLTAHINVPAPRQSPQLRSSRPRVPLSANKKPIELRPPTTSRTKLRQTTKPAHSTGNEGKPKKNIPELGNVDFAARRKMIAVAFNDRMDKEREEELIAKQKRERDEERVRQIQTRKVGANTEQITSNGMSNDSGFPSPVGLGLNLIGFEATPDTKSGEEGSIGDEAADGDISINQPTVQLQLDSETSHSPTSSSTYESTPVIPFEDRSTRPLSVITASPVLPSKPDEYRRWSQNLPSPSFQPPYRPKSVVLDPSNSIVSPLSVGHLANDTPVSPEVPSKVPNTEPAVRLSQYSIANTSNMEQMNEWEKAVEEESKRRKQIEEDRERKIKSRLSMPPPPTPKIGGVWDETSKSYVQPKFSPGHRKQSSMTSGARLAPPETLGTMMWQYRPLSTGGDSMIDSFYREQDDMPRSKNSLPAVEDVLEMPAEPRYQLRDNEYIETEDEPAEEDEQEMGYVQVEGTYRYSASTVNSSVQGKSVDPSDYWTPQPPQDEFDPYRPRESWNTNTTMTSYTTNTASTGFGSAAAARRMMDRERPSSDNPPTPPPKDFVGASPLTLEQPLPLLIPDKRVSMEQKLNNRRASLPLNFQPPVHGFHPSNGDIKESPADQYFPSSKTSSNHDEVESDASSSHYSDEASSVHSSIQTGGSAPLYSMISPTTSVVTTSESFLSQAQEPETMEIKLLTRRRHLLKELLDTEKAFFHDMTVTEEIYKGTTDACMDLKPDDVKTMFGNVDSVVTFSRGFLETLKAAIAPVYVPIKAAKSQVLEAEDNRDSTSTLDKLDVGQVKVEEFDRRTWVGEAFGQALPRMEKVYGDYCKNHDIAINRLATLEKVKGVAIWLKECKHVADDLTNAWSLESLLIKPIQRILKYPLLVDQILQCTPQDHPDYTALELANKELKVATERINEMKKRKDLVDKLVGPRKRADSDIRHGFSKGFQRKAEKLRQSVGLSEGHVDDKYEEAVGKFRFQYFQLQLIIRDIEMSVGEREKQFLEYLNIGQKIDDFATCLPTRFTDHTTRWNGFLSTMKDLRETALLDYKFRVKRHVLVPLEIALRMCDHPQKVMLKRDKKSVDFARYRAIRDKGDRPDKKTKELADAFSTINDTLLDELPKLSIRIGSLVRVILVNFLEVCCLWEQEWQAKLETLLDPLDLPSNFSDIIEVYKGDFNKIEPRMQTFTITDSQSTFWQMEQYKRTMSSTSLITEGSTHGSISLHRATSRDDAPPSGRIGSISSMNTPRIDQRFSITNSQSPLLTAIAPALPLLPGAGRGRTVSAIQTNGSPHISTPPITRAFSSSAAPPLVRRSSSSNSLSRFIPSSPVSQHRPLPNIPAIESVSPTTTRPSTSSEHEGKTVLGYPVMWLCASVYEYQASMEANLKRDDGFAYLTYEQGEIFDVIGTKGEYWLAKNQDDETNEFGWIWSKHFAKLAA